MDPTVHNHIPPQIEPGTVEISWGDPRAESRVTLSNRSSWPIVYKVKVQESFLNFFMFYPAQGIVGTGSSVTISMKLDIEKIKEKRLDLTHGHRVHVESWYISHDDAARLENSNLLYEIKTKVYNLRKPDISPIRIRYSLSAQTPATSYHSFRKIPPSGPVSFVPRPEIPISAHHPTGSMPSPEPSTAYGKISKFIGSMLQPWSIRDTSTVSSAAGPVIIRHPPPLDWVSTDTQDVVPLAPHVEEPVSLIAGDGSWSTLIGQFSQTPPESPSTRLPSAPNAPQSISATRSEDQWITYFAVDRYMRGRVKEPQGSFISSGVLSGAFSDVYKCDVRFSMPAETNPKMVAVKVLRHVGVNQRDEAEVFQRMVGRLAREVTAWSAIIHPNVVPILGFTATPVLSLISPWYEKGNIRKYLVEEPSANRLKLLLDMAKGLAHLHSLNPVVIHGDLKPKNVLINDRQDAVITDFGLSRIMEANPQYRHSDKKAGSIRWMAPELLEHNGGQPGTAADVYSYGMLAFEIMTGKLPTSGRYTERFCPATRDPDNFKEPVDDWKQYPQLPDAIKEMVLKCWSNRPERRPSMGGIEKGLAMLLEGRNISREVDLWPTSEQLKIVSLHGFDITL